MKLGITNTAYDATWKNPSGYLKMREHGYECADFQGLLNKDSDYYHNTDLLLREYAAAEAAGISFSQLHGIWPTDDSTEAGRTEKAEHLAWAIEHAHLLHCTRVVYHPDMPLGWFADDEALVYRSNLAMIRRLLPTAEKHGVCVCIENMPMTKIGFSRVERMMELVHEIDHPLFGMCLDTGHVAVFGEQPADAVRLIGDKLFALHVHDNDGTADQHRLPGTGIVDFDSFRAALHEAGFDGTFSFETSPSGQLPPTEREAALIELAAFGKRMIQ